MGSEGRAALGSSMVSSVRVDAIFRIHCSGGTRGRVYWFRFLANRRQTHSGEWPHACPGLVIERREAPCQDLSDNVGARGREASVTVVVSDSVCLTRELSVAASSPVSTDRIRDLLRSRDVRFGDYNEGELAYLTPNAAFFWNATNPQILQLRAQWRGIARTPEQFGELAREIAACNSTRTGPKAYLAPLEDGTQYGLIAECNVVVMSGLTQAQLDNFFETSMSMIMGFFADLEVTLPGFVDWDPQGREVSL